MWTPLSVSTMSLISPTSKSYVASSKGFCIWPRPKVPANYVLKSHSADRTMPSEEYNLNLIYNKRENTLKAWTRLSLKCKITFKQIRRLLPTRQPTLPVKSLATRDLWESPLSYSHHHWIHKAS